MGSNILAGSAGRARGVPGSEFPKVPGLTEYVGQFVASTRYEDIPEGVIELGKKSILDGLGLALAGSRAQTGSICREYLGQLGICDGKSSIIGSSIKTSPRFAAFVNGVSIHADDFDDTQLSAAKDRVYGLLVHPTVPVLPAVLAVTEGRAISGKEFMLAYHLGVEVECKIAEAISPRHYQDGFHSTGTCGPFGSAAACAKLLQFDLSKIQNTFGLAASQSGGLRENFGTMTKPFQAGHAAESGLLSAGLVSLSLSHPAMTELARLINAHKLQSTQVQKLDIGANHQMTTTLLHHRPKTGLEAKFSMEFCLAILLLRGKAGLNEFSDPVVQSADVQEMIGRVNFYVEPEAESAGFDKMTSLLRIHLRDGRVISGRADFAKGSPANPMSFDEAAAKFRGCAEFAEWPRQKTEKLITCVKTLDSTRDISALSPLLSAEKG